MKKILILGYFGYVTNQLDGQTVKTRDMRQLLEEQFGAGNIDFYDTQEFKSSRKSIFTMFRKICRCKGLVYLPAHNNLKYIFPLIWILSKLCCFDIHYFVVGGWLCEFIQPLPVHQLMLRHIKGIHVETKQLKSDLEQNYKYKNVDIFPNFRFSTANLNRAKAPSAPLKLAFISRVCESKGLDTLNKLYEQVHHQGLDNLFTIDFYGQKTDSYFNTHLKDIANYHYNGILKPEDVIPTLNKYDALIFPTHYEGEGCPGILIEALFAGLPIIASNWKYNSEFVENGVNGILCETCNVADYVKAIHSLSENHKLIDGMSEAAIKKASEFSSELAALRLKQILKN